MMLDKFLKGCVRRFCSASLRRFIARRTKTWRDLRSRADAVRQKECVTVAFMVMDLPCWRCDSVYQAMLKHPRFRPVIWIIDEVQITDESEKRRNLEAMRFHFAERGYTVAEQYSLERIRSEYAPDVVFLSKPSADISRWNVWRMNRELVCYVPYCFQNTKKNDFIHGQECYFWRNYYTTLGIKKLASSVMTNGGCNVVSVGSPVADNYLSKETGFPKSVWRNCGKKMKRLIWAPHWSIGNVSWFSVATFLEVADDMLMLAEKYADCVQWAFKPHPLLRDTLYRQSDWGKERTDAYYNRWASMPNTQLETGAYVDLFKQSDAMVHDSGSFIIEYLLVNKPCMYLQRNNDSPDFNDDTLKALECYQIGRAAADVEQFILSILNGIADTKESIRIRYREEYLVPPGGSSAQLIIDDILHGKY